MGPSAEDVSRGMFCLSATFALLPSREEDRTWSRTGDAATVISPHHTTFSRMTIYRWDSWSWPLHHLDSFHAASWVVKGFRASGSCVLHDLQRLMPHALRIR